MTRTVITPRVKPPSISSTSTGMGDCAVGSDVPPVVVVVEVVGVVVVVLVVVEVVVTGLTVTPNVMVASLS